MNRRRVRLQRAQLYLCLADRPDLGEFVEATCAAGVDIVQLRDKELDARPLLARAAIARDAAHAHGALFVLNDRPDLALECGADGVHVGQDDAPASLCRRLLGDDRLVGLSTHAPDELRAAISEPIDYVSVGPIVATPTKPGRAGTGLDYVRFATAQCGALPFFVTGGIAPATLADVAGAGATRFVVVRALTEAPTPDAAAAVVHQLRAVLPPLPTPAPT
ncbi:MAG: thiamine-phosphate pyrophosphorylase [Actinomycetota bacterium]|jgi:thiamine-phosphate pyrophosphorylase